MGIDRERAAQLREVLRQLEHVDDTAAVRGLNVEAMPLTMGDLRSLVVGGEEARKALAGAAGAQGERADAAEEKLRKLVAAARINCTCSLSRKVNHVELCPVAVALADVAGLCPRDTDGDGNCGQRACPVCGEDRLHPVDAIKTAMGRESEPDDANEAETRKSLGHLVPYPEDECYRCGVEGGTTAKAIRLCGGCF